MMIGQVRHHQIIQMILIDDALPVVAPALGEARSSLGVEVFGKRVSTSLTDARNDDVR
jgi:hypothetical protein